MKNGINHNRLQAPVKEASDAELLAGLREGDDRLIACLYRKYYLMVLKMVLGNNGREEEARDVYQDCIIVLYENVRKSDFVLSCALQTYIYAVARRLWLKQLRKQGKLTLMKEEEDRDVEDAGRSVNEHLEKEQEIERMNESLASLGEPCATILNDFYVAGLNMEEIAEKFGYTGADNAKNQKYKCLQRLKRSYFGKRVEEKQQYN
jgi:RNA polymerase sigma factor (sigma-70 family)